MNEQINRQLMISPNMRTVIFMGVLTNILCLLVILSIWRQNRNRFAGTTFWVYNNALQAAAFVLIGLRGIVPDWASIVVSNTMVMTGTLLGYAGLLRFTQKKSRQLHNYLLLAVFIAVQSYFTMVRPDLDARNLNVAVGLLVICFQCMRLMIYDVGPTMKKMTRDVGMVFTLYCLLCLVRIGQTLSMANSQADFMRSGTFDALIIASFIMLVVLQTYSLALMCNRRLLIDIGMQEEKFSRAFYSSPYAVIVTRAHDGRILEVNRGFEHITGYTATEVKGRTTGDLHLWVREEDRTMVVNELLQHSTMQNRELLFRKKSGALITGLFSADTIIIGEETHILSSINDISGRKQLELERERFIHLANSSNEFIGMCDLEMNPIYVNPAGMRMVGLGDISAACSIKVQDYFFPDDQDFIRDEFFPKVLDEGQGTVEIRLRHFITGEPVWMLYYLFTVRDTGGNTIGWATISRDITESRQAKIALHESEQKYRTLIATMMNAFALHEMIFDDSGEPADYRFLEVNPAWEKTVGIKAEEVIGRTIREIMPTIEERWIKLYGRVVKTGIAEEFEDYNSGTDKYYQVFAYSPSAGKFAVFFNDITVRKTAEEAMSNSLLRADRSRKAMLSAYEDLKIAENALRALNAELDDRIRTRTAQLEASNKELEAFSYSVSHDLRAPLRAIHGFGQMLTEDFASRLGDEGQRQLGVIISETKRMGKLIDDLLAFSRLSRQKTEVVSVDMTMLVTIIFNELAGNAPGRVIRFDCQPLIAASGDPPMLRVALTNLIMNAIKFTKNKNPAIIWIGNFQKDDQTVYFIKDNGVGFDMKYADKLFGVFQRLHSDEEIEGTGIGLSLVQRIIHRHGGSIWAEGHINEGATFFFTLSNKKL